MVDAGDVDGVFDVVEVELQGGVGPVDEVVDAADANHAAAVGNGLHLVVVEVAAVFVEGAAGAVAGDDGGLGGLHGVPEGWDAEVGDVDEHADLVHGGDEVVAEFGEAAAGVVGALAVAGVGADGVGDGHGADADAVEHGQDVEAAFEGLGVLDSQHGGNFAGGLGLTRCRRR